MMASMDSACAPLLALEFRCIKLAWSRDAADARPEQLPELTALMLKAGYEEADVRGVLGENFLRVAREVWK